MPAVTGQMGFHVRHYLLSAASYQLAGEFGSEQVGDASAVEKGNMNRNSFVDSVVPAPITTFALIRARTHEAYSFWYISENSATPLTSVIFVAGTLPAVA
jgi:hypothetical protein